jgi:hypothetical protein
VSTHSRPKWQRKPWRCPLWRSDHDPWRRLVRLGRKLAPCAWSSWSEGRPSLLLLVTAVRKFRKYCRPFWGSGWVGFQSPWDSVTLMLQRRGRFLPDDKSPVQLALVISFAGGGAPLLLLGLPVRHMLPSHLLGRRDVSGSSSSAPFRASCGLGLLCGEDVRMECRQRPGWLVVPAPDHVSGDRPGPGRVSSSTRTPTCSASVRPWYRGSLGPYSPNPGGIRVAPAGVAAAASGACRRRPAGPGRPASPTAGAAFSPLGLKLGGGPPTRPFSSLARAGVLAASPFALAAGVVSCCSRVVARSSARPQ